MASLFKRQGSACWYGRFQHEGKDVCFSTGESSKGEARKVLNAKMAELRGELSLMTEFQKVLEIVEAIESEDIRDKTRQDLAARLLQGSVNKVAVADAWDTWLTNPKKRNPGDSTLKSYKRQLERFTKWLAKHHKEVAHLHQISAKMAEDYMSGLWATKVSPATYNRHLVFLKGMFRVLKTQAGLTTNVWMDLPAMRKEQQSRRNLTPEELAIVCSKAKGEMRFWFAIGIYTGLRLGDVLTLRWEEVDLDKGIIERVPMKTRRTGKAIRCPIHPHLAIVLQELMGTKKEVRGYLFPESAEVYLRDNTASSKRIQQHFIDCGIETLEAPTGGHRKNQIVRVGFHSLRHSFVSLCAANRVPQVAIMELVGHGSPAMTALYSHAGDEQKAQAIAALPVVNFDLPPEEEDLDE